MPGNSPHVGADLSKFQLRILALLAARNEPPKGLAIKSELSDYYGEDVYPGRLYPNLTELSEQGFVDISEKDKRTNSYRLTDEGYEVLNAEVQWLQNQLSSS